MKKMWRVSVIDYGREALMLRARNSATGKTKSRTASSDKRREANREAAAWEAELNERGHIDAPRLAEAVQLFMARYAASRRKGTQQKFQAVFGVFVQTIGNPKLSDIDERLLAEFSAKYGRGVTVSTLASALRHIRVMLRWANRNRLLPALPHIEMPRSAQKAKGMALVGEQVERILLAVPQVRPRDSAAWEFLIRGLWTSGLRISEALALEWEEGAVAIVGMEGGRPKIRIQGEAQKGGKLTEAPCPPEFAELLGSIPEAERRGRVFKVSSRRREVAGAIIGKCCRKAGIKASAHDFRRGFATRWARRLPAQALQRLMRHSSLATTMTFYAVGDIGLEDAMWGEKGNKSGNTSIQADSQTVEKR
jgi:integrase